MMNVLSAKVVMVGDTGVGKTAISNRFIRGEFDPGVMSSVGVDFTRKKVTIDGETVSLVLYDTAGQEVFRSLAPQYYRDAQIAIVVFSLIDEDSFKGAERWIEDIEKTNPSVEILLVGNKADMEDTRLISFEDAQTFADKHDFLYVETSAATGQNINDLFDEAARLFLRGRNAAARLTMTIGSSTSISITEENEDATSKKCC